MEPDSLPKRDAAFIAPMECLSVAKLPEGSGWVYEIKLDGYRAVGINAKGKLRLYSKKRKPFRRQYQGRPNFNLLQHSKSQAKRICYFVFDLLVYQNRDLTRVPLIERREILKSLTFSLPLPTRKLFRGSIRLSRTDD